MECRSLQYHCWNGSKSCPRFLLARLHLESLVDKMTPTEIRIALESLPKGNEALPIAYDQAMRRIEPKNPG